MSHNEIDILKRALENEKQARMSAEKLLEEKSRELIFLSDELKKTNHQLTNFKVEKSLKFKGVFNTIIDAFIVMNLKGHVIKMNDAAKDFFGYNIDKERLSVMDLVYEEDKEEAVKTFIELSERGYYTNYISRAVTRENVVKWVQINASLIYDSDMNPIGAQGIVRDITKDKEAQSLLLQSKNRLSTLIVNLDSGILLEDDENKIILTNKKFCDLLKIKLNPDLLVGVDSFKITENCKDYFINGDEFESRIEELKKKRKQVLGEQIVMKDGTVIERDFIPLIQDDTKFGILWSYKDVSLSRKFQKSIENQKSKYSHIINNMNLGLVEIDLKGQILLVNQRLCSMSGFSEEELIGKRIGRIFPISKDNRSITNQNENLPNSYEIRVKNKSRRIRHWLISGASNFDLKGKKVGSIGVCLDITELKSLEKQKEKIRKQLEKSNAELQEYTHIVSHDLKSPLRSISALTEWIKSDNEGKFDESTLQNFELIEKTLEKMELLISDLLIFSSAGTQIRSAQDVDLDSEVKSLIEMMYVPTNISIKIKKELPRVHGDKTKFRQLFQNLIGNAIKFIDKDKGKIEIDAIDRGSFYQFSIKDNGIGIDKKYHNKIFKIFHSLQESKESTGIGLSIVKKIVDLYKGEIWLESKPKKGTTFFFTIKK